MGLKEMEENLAATERSITRLKSLRLDLAAPDVQVVGAILLDHLEREREFMAETITLERGG